MKKYKSKKIIGLMSGTSLDSIDAVLIEVSGNGTKTKIKEIGFIEYPFPKGMKELILKNSLPGSGNVTDICRLNALIPLVYVDAVKSLLNKVNISINDIDLIGSHGQTIHHLPKKENLFGYKVASTLQIGDPTVIAKKTGVVTVGDFRTGDVALGGQGAPLVPYFDYIMFHSKKKNRALLNIGGIANITVLAKNCSPNEVFAFDTGPGNMNIDFISKKYFNIEFDKDGLISSKGEVDKNLFDLILKKDTYKNLKPPKSTGREFYGERFVEKIISEFGDINSNNLLSTFNEYTAYSVFNQYKKFIQKRTEIEELFVSGGGVKNKFLMERLQYYFGEKVKVKNANELNITSDAKEAICFAILANETMHGNSSNLPSVTGASKPTILGKICLP